MTEVRPAGDVLSHFWAPLCAVGASGSTGPNAQICVSVFGASIVPERPDGDKLAGLDCELTASGSPAFPGGVGALDCEVLEALDLGDATAFLVAVRERWGLGGEQPLPWSVAKTVVGEEFLRAWAEKSAREQEAARAVMHWRD